MGMALVTRAQKNEVRKHIETNGYKPVTSCGIYLEPAGRGLYPYDCISKSKNPNAMIYRAESGTWTHENCECFILNYWEQHVKHN
jgi:hypothetical protein